MLRAIVLSCSCRRWARTTRTASSSATSCTAATATVPGPCEHTCGWTAVRSETRRGTLRGLTASSGTRLSWLSAPSGPTSTRSELFLFLLLHFYKLLWLTVFVSQLGSNIVLNVNNILIVAYLMICPTTKMCRPTDRCLVEPKICNTIILCWFFLILASRWIYC